MKVSLWSWEAPLILAERPYSLLTFLTDCSLWRTPWGAQGTWCSNWFSCFSTLLCLVLQSETVMFPESWGYLLRLNIEWPHDTFRGIVENLWTVSSVPGKLEEPKCWQALFRTTALTSWGKTWEGELVFQFSSSPRGNFHFMFCTILFLKAVYLDGLEIEYKLIAIYRL